MPFAHLYLNYSSNLITCLEIDNTVLILLPDHEPLEEKEKALSLVGRKGSTAEAESGRPHL